MCNNYLENGDSIYIVRETPIGKIVYDINLPKFTRIKTMQMNIFILEPVFEHFIAELEFNFELDRWVIQTKLPFPADGNKWSCTEATMDLNLMNHLDNTVKLVIDKNKTPRCAAVFASKSPESDMFYYVSGFEGETKLLTCNSIGQYGIHHHIQHSKLANCNYYILNRGDLDSILLLQTQENFDIDPVTHHINEIIYAFI